MTQFKKVFSALLAGFISMSNLTLECQAYGCVLLQSKKPNTPIYHMAKIYNNFENAFRSVVVAREKVKFISEKMGRLGLYILDLNEIANLLNLALEKQFVCRCQIGAMKYINSKEIFEEQKEIIFKEQEKIFQNQQVEFDRMQYSLGIKLGELKMKNPEKYSEADDEFQKNYFPSWKARWNGIEIYKL